MQPTSLARRVIELRDNCTRCGTCVRQCAFLHQHGYPAELAAQWVEAEKAEETPSRQVSFAYACSQCGLCAAVCPEGLDPGQMLLEMRRHEVASGRFHSAPYRALLAHETLGASPLFSWHATPEGCDTVLFPGCELPGTRPAILRALFSHLRQQIPSLGLVLACCGKPSHDLGRTDRFHDIFFPLWRRLRHKGVRTILTACPNCTAICRAYGQGIEVRTVYEQLACHPLPAPGAPGENTVVTIHDPCPLRHDQASQDAVRSLLATRGYHLEEMTHRGQRTLCCGEGGAVVHADPQLARTWTSRRIREAKGRLLVTSCAGCTSLLGRQTPTVHLLDLLFAHATSARGHRIARPSLTYLNRLLCKWRLRALLRRPWRCSKRLP